MADDGLEGGGRAGQLRERHEVALAQEGEEIGADVGSWGSLADEGGLEAGEKGRSHFDHGVAVGNKSACDSGGVGAVGAESSRVDDSLVDTKAVGIGFVCRDCTIAGEETVRVIEGLKRIRSVCKLKRNGVRGTYN